jgi:hypothetical protein
LPGPGDDRRESVVNVDWLVWEFAPFGINTHIQNWTLVAVAIIGAAAIYAWWNRV